MNHSLATCHLPLATATRLRSQRGIALLIVVSMLTVIGIIGVAFAFSMFLERQASRQFVSTVQARYLAESGVQHGWALLDEDRLGSRSDDLTEAWAKAPAGTDVAVDDAGAPDARWWLVNDASDRPVGRYAMKISDEAAKANLNAAQADPSLLGLGAMNLTTLLQEAGVHNAHEAALAIERYQYGDDGRPGLAQVDDDGDGAVDDAQEYQPLALRGDDRRIDNLEDLASIAGLDHEIITRLSQFMTVYSWDLNVGVSGKARVNVNTATAEELLVVLMEAGVEDPWQAAANMADYVDADLAMSRLSKNAVERWMTNQGPLGAWQWVDAPVGHYESRAVGGSPLSWSITAPAGTFRMLARGVSGSKIGDLTVAGTFKPSVDSGEFLGMFTFTGSETISVTVSDQEPSGTLCAFRGLVLVPEAPEPGQMIRGIEAVRLNELMAEPTMELKIPDAIFDSQGSDWACPVGQAACTNSGVGQARWMWTSPLLQPGRYYVVVFGAAVGQTVGEVRIDGNSKLLVHGQHHPSLTRVGSDGKFTLTIGKTDPEKTYYIQRAILSRQPDAEYIELINLSEREIHVGGWSIQGEATGGRQAVLPANAAIKPHGLLVAAVDLDDTQPGLENNGISAHDAWDIPDDANAVQLEFPNGGPTPEDDWLKTTVSGGHARLVLQNQGTTVEEVEYPLPLPATANFQSLEKGDPTALGDADGDGIDDLWYPSLTLYTPGQANDNAGLKDSGGAVHAPASEITARNRPLEGIGELAGLASGTAWQRFSSADLAKIVDRLTVDGIRLEAEGRLAGGQDAWAEKLDGTVVHTNAAQADVSGAWQWIGIQDGDYRLGLYGWPGEQLSIRWQRADQSFSEWSPPLLTDAQGRIAVGALTIGGNGTPPGTLTLEAVCASVSGICHLDYIRLDPRLIRIGPVNVNTVSLEVLRAMPGMTEALASRIVVGRPYGDQHQKSRGIGDLLAGDVLGSTEEDTLDTFRMLGHLLTTRSDMFEIISMGQAMEAGRAGAVQRVRTVIQRQENPQ